MISISSIYSGIILVIQSIHLVLNLNLWIKINP